MTDKANELPSPTPTPSRAPLLVGLLVIIGVPAAIVLAWLLEVPGLTSSDGGKPTLEYTTALGSTSAEGVVDSALKVTLRIPQTNASMEQVVSNVGIQLLKLDGTPARIGDTESKMEAMNPSLEFGVWVYESSMPSDPGAYYSRVSLNRLNGPSDTLDFKEAALTAKPETGPPLRSGFVFSRNANLWMLSTDASREKRITFYPSYYEYADNASWSPDGELIAYTYSPKVESNQVPYTEIWVVGRDGTGARPVAKHGASESLLGPTWSGDGKFIYFTVESTTPMTDTSDLSAYSTQTWRIDKVDINTGVRSQWAPNGQMPSAGKQGRGIVYLETVPLQEPDPFIASKQRLALADPSGSNSAVLVDEESFLGIYAPRISPDGEWVVFAAVGAANQSPPTPGGFDFFKWLLISPEVTYAHGLPWELFLIPSSGGKSNQLTGMNEDQPYAAWLDGSTLAFMGSAGLYTLGIDGSGMPVGQPAKIHNGAPHGGLTWHGP